MHRIIATLDGFELWCGAQLVSKHNTKYSARIALAEFAAPSTQYDVLHTHASGAYDIPGTTCCVPGVRMRIGHAKY